MNLEELDFDKLHTIVEGNKPPYSMKDKVWVSAFTQQHCLRRLRFMFLGKEQTNTVQIDRCSEIGNCIHNSVEKELRTLFKDKVLTEVKQIYKLGKFDINFKCDAIFSDEKVLEIKTIDGSKDIQLPREEDVDQLNMYLFMMEWEVGFLAYFDRTSGKQVKVVKVEKDKNRVFKIVKKIKDVTDLSLPTEELERDTRNCKFCPFSSICLGMEIELDKRRQDDGVPF